MPGIGQIKPSAIITAVTAGFGSLVGLGLGGAPGALTGAKLGGALGVQIALVNKGEQAVDLAGKKIDNLTDKADKAVDKVGEKICSTIERVADAWSRLFLCGYAGQLALNGANQSMLNYNQFCKSGFESLNCASMTLTTLSFNMFAIASGAALIREIYKKVQ